MKTIKYLLWLIIIGLLATLIYQNLDYFMHKTALELDLKISTWHWSIPGLENIAYFGICFLLGLILAGFKGLRAKFRLKKEIKTKNIEIVSLLEQVTALKTELTVFTHDPYIKKNMEERSIVNEQPVPEPSKNDSEKGNNSDTAD